MPGKLQHSGERVQRCPPAATSGQHPQARRVPCSALPAGTQSSPGWELPAPIPTPPAPLPGRCQPQRPWGSSPLTPQIHALLPGTAPCPPPPLGAHRLGHAPPQLLELLLAHPLLDLQAKGVEWSGRGPGRQLQQLHGRAQAPGFLLSRIPQGECFSGRRRRIRPARSGGVGLADHQGRC